MSKNKRSPVVFVCPLFDICLLLYSSVVDFNNDELYKLLSYNGDKNYNGASCDVFCMS